MAGSKHFSIQDKLVNLHHLQIIDSKIDKLRVIQGELPEEVQILEDELIGLKNRQINIEEEINGINEYILNKQLSIKDAQNLVAKYEKQSDNVKNSREYEAITKEIELQKLEVKLFEKHIRDANEDLIDKIKHLDTAKKKILSKETTLKQKKDELNIILEETEKEEIEYKSKSEISRKNIEPSLLYSYDKIRKSYKNGLAVVKVERDACGGCFNSIPPQRQIDIRIYKKIIICENCGRILIDDSIIEQTKNKELIIK